MEIKLFTETDTQRIALKNNLEKRSENVFRPDENDL
jgi:hypothetical protein